MVPGLQRLLRRDEGVAAVMIALGAVVVVLGITVLLFDVASRSERGALGSNHAAAADEAARGALDEALQLLRSDGEPGSTWTPGNPQQLELDGACARWWFGHDDPATQQVAVVVEAIAPATSGCDLDAGGEDAATAGLQALVEYGGAQPQLLSSSLDQRAAAQPLPDGAMQLLLTRPLGLWRLDELSVAANNRTLSARVGPNGSYAAAPSTPTLAQKGALPRETNSAALFDGSNDYASVPLGSLLGGAPLTLSAWVSLDGIGNGQGALTLTNGDGDRLTLYARGGGGPITLGDGSASALSTQTLSAGGWHHIAVTVSAAGKASFFLDGQAAGSDALGTAPLDDPTLLTFGRGDSSGEQLNGWLDEAALWDRELSAAEIGALAAQGSYAGF